MGHGHWKGQRKWRINGCTFSSRTLSKGLSGNYTSQFRVYHSLVWLDFFVIDWCIHSIIYLFFLCSLPFKTYLMALIVMCLICIFCFLFIQFIVLCAHLIYFPFIQLTCVLRTRASLDCSPESKMTLTSWSISASRVLGTLALCLVLRIEPRASCMPGKHSAH